MSDTPKRMVTSDEIRSVLDPLIKDKDFIKNIVIEKREDFKSGTMLDDIIPIFKESLTIISAPPKSGKSLFSMHLALNLSWNENRVLYISLENSLRQDKERWEEACATYGKEDTSDYWFYLNLRDVKFENKLPYLLAAIATYDFNVIFIDAPERAYRNGESGASISSQGRLFIDSLLNARGANDSKPAIVCTWQFNKENITTKGKEATLASLGGSISVVQQADSIWTILKGDKKNEWDAILIDSREKYDDKNTSFSVISDEKFNIVNQYKDLLNELKGAKNDRSKNVKSSSKNKSQRN